MEENTILKGDIIKDEVLSSLKKEIDEKGFNISYTILSIGEDEASKIYIGQKIKMAKELGIRCLVIDIAGNVQTEEVIDIIQSQNNDPNTNGIIVQLPIPKHLDKTKIINSISPKKDIDGLTSYNLGKLINNEKGLFPATASGVVRLLDYYKIPLEGRNVLVVNRSTLVGKPLSLMLLNRSATVTIAHSKTDNLPEILKHFDIIISAVGRKDIIKKEYVSDDAVLVDIGVSRIDGRIYGDIEEILKEENRSTPTIGGVGPLTIAMLAENIVEAYKIQNGINEDLIEDE